MFKIFRRISYGVIPRSDRPWEEDPTSNAPQVRRKRRLSSAERDAEEEEEVRRKKIRGKSAMPSVADAEAKFLVPAPQADTQEVKEVTKGVEEVVLDGKDDEISSADVAAPESIPLPVENSGELDEPTSDATPSPVGAPPTSVEDSSKVFAEQATTITADESSDIASSCDSPPETAQNPTAPEPVSTSLVPGCSDDVTTEE